jgi:hypothetical protein
MRRDKPLASLKHFFTGIARRQPAMPNDAASKGRAILARTSGKGRAGLALLFKLMLPLAFF